MPTEAGSVAFAHVDADRYAAWSCKGEPAWLRTVGPDGTYEDLPITDAIRNELSLGAFLDARSKKAQ